MLSLKAVFHLPLRQTEGFVCSLFKLMGITLPVANYSRLSRRAPGLKIKLRRETNKAIKDLVIDSTGVKVYGEGEWKVRTHGKDKRRTWRKLHIAVDCETWEITAVELTDKGVVDPRVLPSLLEETEGEVEKAYGDGAYDTNQCYKAIYKKGAKAIIPPRKGAVERKYYYLKDRNEAIREKEEKGEKGWKKESGYHKRSLVETEMGRIKGIVGERMMSRKMERQVTEARIKCMVLNRMSELGMPETVAIEKSAKSG